MTVTKYRRVGLPVGTKNFDRPNVIMGGASVCMPAFRGHAVGRVAVGYTGHGERCCRRATIRFGGSEAVNGKTTHRVLSRRQVASALRRHFGERRRFMPSTVMRAPM